MNTGAVTKVAALYLCKRSIDYDPMAKSLKKEKVIISDNLSEVPSGFEPL